MSAGVVVIGRNEGERLKRCLESMDRTGRRVVYVDSGSTDGSAEMAAAMGADVVALDMRIPFTAARARNEGYRRLRELEPGLRSAQFVDGDCELIGGWLDAAEAFLSDHADVAAVCGWLREKHPSRSIYNMLCAIEWEVPPGESKACGGIAMMRTRAFDQVGGFRPDMIAGEEPELCVRLRAAGWRIWRLDAEMARHDAAMSRFGQWWKRTVRAGFTYAQGADMHGAPPERHRVRESRSAWFWGLGVPLACAVAVALYGPAGLLTLAIYPAQVTRLALRGTRSLRENWWWAVFLVIGKFPQVVGQLKYLTHRRLGAAIRLIEYK
jgi:GT2 family glycosyltransferase